MPVLSIEHLSKSYGKIRALNNVNFSVPEGSVFGILGPTGSGKTTLLGTVMDVIKPTSGTYRLFDEAPTEHHRKKIGTLLETPNFYHYLSGVKNLEIAAEIKQHGKEDIPKVLDMVDLTKRKDSKFSTYSLGMKQRLAIASCLLGSPGVLVFDEPANGLDPVGIAEIRSLMKELHAQGKTIIMASHLLDEVEKVCTHVAILKTGELITTGNVNEILSNEDMVEAAATDNEKLMLALQKMDANARVVKEGGYIKIFVPVNTADLAAINNYCFNNGIVLNHLLLKKKSLESRFFELTNN
ncbi:MAG: ATP-binding cassette domain-containing protein [Bacteroidota bacterium]|nr:ATP-binding cassette domain-containing protein [Bacteroidota bacterium]